jgi:carboxypeptidase D
LKGLLIGNGWIDPVNQYPAYSTYAYEAGIIKHGTDQGKLVDDEFAKCKKIMDEGSHVSIEQCENVLNTILRVTRNEYIHF